MKIVVGIGNPGRRYEGTRHNVGFQTIEILAGKLAAGIPRERFESATQEANVDGEKVLLLRPLTYVNLSGTAVRRTMDWFRLEPCDIMVITDDVHLPPGKIRARRSGSSGGHNGIESIINHLGTIDFPRIRIGIGRPAPQIDLPDYVLGRFTEDEAPRIEDARRMAAEGVLTWVREGLDACLRFCNQKAELDEPDDPAPAKD